MDPKLGRRTPVTRPRLALDDFLEDPKPQIVNNATRVPAVSIPAEVHRTDWKLPNPMLANGPDQTVTINSTVAVYGVGCCVEAMILKAIRHMLYAVGKPVPDFTGDDALRLYSRITGYDPAQTAEDGSNPTDQGTEPNSAFTFWQHEGVPLPDGTVHKIAGFVSVNPTDPRQWEAALTDFDCLGVGLNLPRTILTQDQHSEPWAIVDSRLEGDSAPGSLGGHEILRVSYDQARERNYSWEERPLTIRSFAGAYCDQLTAFISPDQLGASGVSETGLNWTALLEAAGELASL
jgi:hypothetical protein